MPTDEEIQQYGANLSIWDQMRLFQEWSPLIGYAQRFLNEPDQFKKTLIVADALEWLSSKTSSQLDDQLVKLVANIVHTQQGEALIRWALLAVEGKR
jgi:hypothetical protein